MRTWSDWLALDGFGVYVWPSYALTFIAVAVNIYWARRSARLARAAALRRIATQEDNT